MGRGGLSPPKCASCPPNKKLRKLCYLLLSLLKNSTEFTSTISSFWLKIQSRPLTLLFRYEQRNLRSLVSCRPLRGEDVLLVFPQKTSCLFTMLVRATYNSVCETYCYLKLVVKSSAASTSSDATASTAKAPEANISAPSTSTALKLSPISAGAAPPHAVSNLNENTPLQPVWTSHPRCAFGRMERWIKEKELKKGDLDKWMIYWKYGLSDVVFW